MNCENKMKQEIICSVIIPVYNEEEAIEQALKALSAQGIKKELFEIIIIDNNSTDRTIDKVNKFKLSHSEVNVVIISEKKQGVAWARKSGMDLAVQRSKERDNAFKIVRPFYILSTDADCYVGHCWIEEQINALQSSQAALSVCHYYYPKEHFKSRPNLFYVIDLKARHYVMPMFGGFPDGKGFAVLREKYEKVKGIEIFYQLSQGKFVCHLSDDWDFGIKMRASGEDIIYCPNAQVYTNPRRVDHALSEMINGVAYGQNGVITMCDIRNKQKSIQSDLTIMEAKLLFDFSIKDFTTKHIILPLLLTPMLLERQAIRDFLSPSLCQKLYLRIVQMTEEMRVKDFTPIHLYKTPCFRLYFEFMDAIFERMRMDIDDGIGYPPILPECLENIKKNEPENYLSYVYYYCEDRESGEAHNYFGNGGVF